MGIPGLTSYVNSTEKLWTTIDLQDTKLVVDGSSLCHYLYEKRGLDCRCGGQYDDFYHAVLSFFDALNSNRVECFVVMDGADDPSNKKLETLKKRAEQNIQRANDLSKSAESGRFLLPLFSKLVFQQALRDRDIKFVICDSEADTEIASLAAAWNCPVLSRDSDFFIFDVKAGYVPLDKILHWNSTRLTVSIFYRRELASYFKIHDELIPLLASLAGNDYVSSDALASFNCALSRLQTVNYRRRGAKFESIANMLSELPVSCTQEEALNSALQLVASPQSRGELRQVVELSLQEYNIQESNLLSYFESGMVCTSLRSQNGYEIEKWVLSKFRTGHFSVKCISGLTAGKCLLRVQVENCEEISANFCSLQLRKYGYSILSDAGENGGEEKMMIVQEWDREGMTVKPSNVSPCQESVVPSVSLIPNLDAQERSQFLLCALNADTPYIKSLPAKFQLVAASLRFLISHAEPAIEVNHLKALLCCCINLEHLSKQQEKTAEVKHYSQPFDLQAAHSFSQWQCVLRDAIHLNFALLEPVPTPCIHKTFSGQMAHSLHEELHQGHTPKDLTSPCRLLPSFHKLYMAVTDDLLQKMAPQDRQGSKEADKKKTTYSCSVSLIKSMKNRFAFIIVFIVAFFYYLLQHGRAMEDDAAR